MSRKKGKVITIFSTKGGAGKTIFTLNLAATYSVLKKKTLIVDLDLYSGGIALALNIDQQKDIYNVVDDLNNNRFTIFTDYITSYNEYIDVLACPKDPRTGSKIEHKYVDIIMANAVNQYEVILFDTSHILNDINLAALDKTDEIILLLSNDPIDLKNMKSVLAIFKENEITNYTVILNESINTHKDIFTVFDIKNIIDNNINWVISRHFHLPQIDKWVLAGDIPLLSKKIQRQKKSDYKRFSKIALSLINDKKGEIKDE